MERTEIHFPSPDRRPRLVRAGVFETKVTGGDDPTRDTVTVLKPIYIHTTRVMSHALAQELRSRARTLIKEEAPES